MRQSSTLALFIGASLLGEITPSHFAQARSSQAASPPTYRGLTPGMPASAAKLVLRNALGRKAVCVKQPQGVTECDGSDGRYAPDQALIPWLKIVIDDSTQRVAEIEVIREIWTMESGRQQAEVLQKRWGPTVVGDEDSPPDARVETWKRSLWSGKVQWQVIPAQRIGDFNMPGSSNFFLFLKYTPLVTAIARREAVPEPE